MKKLKKLVNAAKGVQAITSGDCGSDMVEMTAANVADVYDTMKATAVAATLVAVRGVNAVAGIIVEGGELALKTSELFEEMDKRCQARYDQWEEKYKSIIDHYDAEDKRIDQEEKEELVKDIEQQL